MRSRRAGRIYRWGGINIAVCWRVPFLQAVWCDSVTTYCVPQVEFEARGPEEEDYHGIRRLLQQLFLKNSVVNISKVAETILGEISSS